MTRTMLERQIALATARLDNATTQEQAAIAADDIEALETLLSALDS